MAAIVTDRPDKAGETRPGLARAGDVRRGRGWINTAGKEGQGMARSGMAGRGKAG